MASFFSRFLSGPAVGRLSLLWVTLLTLALPGAAPAQTSPTPKPPEIVSAPASRRIVFGTPIPTYTVTVRGEGPFTYRWYRDYGRRWDLLSTAFTFIPDGAGDYVVSVENAGGSAPAVKFTLQIIPPPAAHLLNLSVLTPLATGEAATLGFVVGGDDTLGTKPLVVRAAGPTLAQFGVGDAYSDPRLELFSGSAKTNENDNWNSDPVYSLAGAFPFAPASKDAALYLPALAAGAGSVRISGSGSGTVLAELYDASLGAAAAFPTPRLLNVSVLKRLGAGLTAGFVIGGSGKFKILIRAVGPSLTPFGVADAASDPTLTLRAPSGTVLATNDNWLAADATDMNKFGAFKLPVGSKDAALVTSLDPGAYTVQVSATGANATGSALVEIYEVP